MAAVAPARPFGDSIVASLAYWRERSRDLDVGSPSRGLYADRHNVYRSVQHGLVLPEAWPAVAEVALQLLPFVRRRMLWPEWVPVLEQLLDCCPERDLRLRFELLIGLGRLHELSLERETARTVFGRAEVLARRLDDPACLARCGYHLGWVHLEARDYAAADRYARSALDALAAAGDGEPWLEAELQRLLGMIAHRRGQLAEAESLLRRAAAMRRAIGKPVELARTLYGLADTLCQAGTYAEAQVCLEEAAALLSPTNDELDKVIVQLNLGSLFFMQGDWRLAEAAFRKADTAWLRRSGDLHRQAILATNLGNALLKLERWAEAESHMGQAAALWEQRGDPVELANAIGTLGEAMAGQGKAAAAAGHFDRAIELVRPHADDAKARRLLAFFEREKAMLDPPAGAGSA